MEMVRRNTFIKFALIITTILLLATGLYRVFNVVLHTPLLGYANDYDFLRITSCLKIRPTHPDISKIDPTPNSPINNYRFDDNLNLPHACVLNSELVFAGFSAAIARVVEISTNSHYWSIKIHGMLHALLLSLVAIGFSILFLLKKKTIASLSNSLIFALILSDPSNTLYFNSFYAEPASLFFLYSSFLLLYCICIFRKKSFFVVSFAISLALLGLSKHQHVLLPWIILSSLIILCWFKLLQKRFIIVAALILASAYISYQAITLDRNQAPYQAYYMKFGSATDTFLLSVLPTAKDPISAAEVLGLPRSCADHRGEGWISPINHPCPEVLNTSRLRIFYLIAKDPAFFIRFTDTALKKFRPWLDTDLGQVGGQDYGRVNQFVFTFSDLIDKIPFRLLVVIFLIPLAIYPYGAYFIIKRRSTRILNLLIILIALISSLYIVFFSSLFGQGFADMAKHNHLFYSLYLSIFVICLVSGSVSFLKRFVNR